MKKTATIVISLLAVLVLAMTALVGCGGGTPESLEGTSWKVTTVNDMSVDDYLKMAGISGEMVISFADGQAALSAAGQTESAGAYTYENGTVTIDGQSGTVEGNKMTLFAEEVTMVLEKK